MAKSNIEPQEGLALAVKMKHTENQMRSLNNKLKSDIRSVQDWRDPQYERFTGAMRDLQRLIDTHLHVLENNQRELVKHAQHLLEGQRKFTQRIM
jgi:uncharacterized protein YukE